MEITVDNRDKRLPIDTEFVRVGRRWTADDKDEYLIEGKVTTKSQIATLVECMGLVYSNPYNFVQQGKISQISSMDDH